MRPISTTTATTTSSSAPSSSLTRGQSSTSTWHSPVPYLFGGLAAMLGLIAFALLILACSYWKLSGQPHNEEENNNNRDPPDTKEGDSANKEPAKVYEEKILVIMAGDDKPTFLATPACAKCSSFGDGVGNNSDRDILDRETCEKSEKEMGNHVDATTLTPQPQETQQQSRQQ